MTTPGQITEILVGGVPLEVARWGGDQGRAPIVLLHEGLGSVGLWRSFPDLLAGRTGRQVVAFSRYGHGRSGPPPQPREIAFFHQEAFDVLPELLGALGLKRPVIVGHSDGASIGLIHASTHPMTALVLMAPHVFVEQLTVEEIRQTRSRFLDGDLRGRMSRHHDDVDAAFWSWCRVWLDPEFVTWTLEEEIGRLSVPTLLIQGTEDPYGSVAQVERIAAGAQGRTEVVLLAGGHSPHLEHPEVVADRIALFLRTLAH